MCTLDAKEGGTKNRAAQQHDQRQLNKHKEKKAEYKLGALVKSIYGFEVFVVCKRNDDDDDNNQYNSVNVFINASHICENANDSILYTYIHTYKILKNLLSTCELY